MITLEDCKQAKEYNYKGLSKDEKPLDCNVNSLFLELDTGIFYFFNGTEWKDISQGITLGESEPTGTISITENGIFDVHDYAEADVDVPAITPTGTISITENGTYDTNGIKPSERKNGGYKFRKLWFVWWRVGWFLPIFSSRRI